MDVVGHAEFLRCVQTAIKTDGDDRGIDEFLRRLSVEHQSAEMRETRLEITGFEILLWQHVSFDCPAVPIELPGGTRIVRDSA